MTAVLRKKHIQFIHGSQRVQATLRALHLLLLVVVVGAFQGCFGSLGYRDVSCRAGESAKIVGPVVVFPFIADGNNLRCIPTWLNQSFDPALPSVADIADTLNDKLYGALQRAYPETHFIGTYYADSLLQSMPAMTLEKAVLVASHEFRCPNVLVLRISEMHLNGLYNYQRTRRHGYNRTDPQDAVAVRAVTTLSLYDNTAALRWSISNTMEAPCHPMLASPYGCISVFLDEYALNGLSGDLQALHDAPKSK